MSSSVAQIRVINRDIYDRLMCIDAWVDKVKKSKNEVKRKEEEKKRKGKDYHDNMDRRLECL